jgi:hypothetical protein
MTPRSEGGAARAPWRWIVLCTAAGLAVLVLAGVLSALHFDDVVTGALVNIGSALLFAWVLFWLESRFAQRVETTVATATAESEARQEERTRTFIEGRLADLQSQIDAAREADDAKARARLNAVVEHLTPATVERALADAINSGLIDPEGITVPAFSGARQEYVRFWCGTTNRTDNSNWDYEYSGLIVEIEVADADFPAVVERACSIEWNPDDDVAKLDREVRGELRRRKHFALAKTLDWSYVFVQLSEALRIAEDLRSADISIGGQLVELIAEDWVLTSGDVERISDHLRVPRGDIELSARSGMPLRESPDVPTPDNVAGAVWAQVVDRVARHAQQVQPSAGDVWSAYSDETPF